MFNIAFCDDDRQFLSIIVPKAESIFRHYRTDVHSYTFDNGNDLITSFSKYRPYYDVIFLDIDMPDMDGEKVAKELRILDKKFKLVFITAYPQEALNTFQYDVLGFLPKNLIQECISKLLNRFSIELKKTIPKCNYSKLRNIQMMELWRSKCHWMTLCTLNASIGKFIYIRNAKRLSFIIVNSPKSLRNTPLSILWISIELVL